jgi:hypothetical protein
VETGTPMNQPYQTTHENNDSFHADTTHVKDDGLATTVVTGDESNNAYKRRTTRNSTNSSART